ncbi:MAG: glycosyltransferase, partial [Gammaproteobacteria bacterium]|nr:glycosyltransferase [Gammaproteobacteria bacterium]
SFQDFEFIIVDDGSTDETASYLDTLDDPRIKVIHQKNMGLGKPLNRWLKSCKGDYIMRLDADDICHAQRAGKQLEYLENNPDVILVGSQYIVFSNKGEGHVSRLPTRHEDIVNGMLRGWHTLSHPTIMFRRSLLDHIEGYVVTGPGEDWSFLLDAARFGKLAVVNEALYSYRLHDGSNAWQGVENTLAGLEYAKLRYEMFLHCNTEYDIDEFWCQWNGRSPIRKLGTRMKAISECVYRRASLNKIEKKYFSYYVRLLLASILNVNKTASAITKRLRRNK